MDYVTGGIFLNTNSERTSLRVRNNSTSVLRIDYTLTVTDLCGSSKMFTGNCDMKSGETKGGDVGFSSFENAFTFNCSCGQVRTYGSDRNTKINHVNVQYTIRDLTAEENARKAAEAAERERNEQQARLERERREAEEAQRFREQLARMERERREREEEERQRQQNAQRTAQGGETSSYSQWGTSPTPQTHYVGTTPQGLQIQVSPSDYERMQRQKREQEAAQAEQERKNEELLKQYQDRINENSRLFDNASQGSSSYNSYAQPAPNADLSQAVGNVIDMGFQMFAEGAERRRLEAEQKARMEQIERDRLAQEKAERDAAIALRGSLKDLYKDSRLPLGNEHGSRTHALYYFIYTYWPGHATEKTFTVTTSGPFQVCRAGDGSWPMERDVREKMESLTPHSETLVGPFDTRLSAQKARDQFVVALQRSGGNVVPSTFDWPCTTDAEGWVDEWQVAPASRTVNGWTVVEGEQEGAPKGNDEWTPR